MSNQIEKLIINSPYDEPKEFWSYDLTTQEFERKQGRRPAMYWRSSQRRANNFDDPGEPVEIPLVNKIRPRVKEWKEKGYPNVTGVTKRLLQYWNDSSQRQYQPFWCQFEAVETAIWLAEASDAEKQGIEIPSDGEWERQCLKLATGTGKTVIMAMLICWQALNKIANPTDARFSKHILIISPGLTVRDRLQVLIPDNEENFYEQFGLLDSAMWQELLQAKIQVTNWHTLAPINENYGPKVVKKGPESDEAFVRRVLPDFGVSKNILVLNDEAHHCHRPSPDELAEEKEKATIWVSGIDRIHNARGVLRSYDLSATPFKPSGGNNQGELLFPWIVSDFGLNDAIEAGLVKTPKVAVRDDGAIGKDLKSKLFHIYPEVKDDLNRRAEPHEGLPDLVRNAVAILGADWLKTKEIWTENKRETPPVMIMIANRTETAARLEHSLQAGTFPVEELGDKDRLIRIDQDALDKIESDESEKLSKSKQELAQEERNKFNSVGKIGKPGEQIQAVIGVNMLSEGWDTRTVTHILGLRAFTSQLLCEQVVGRGLRRISYDLNEDGLFEPEYVTVFGVPFTFLPVEGNESTPREEKPKTKIGPIEERSDLEIKWPHVLRVEYNLRYFLDLDWAKVPKLTLSSKDAPTVVEVASVIEGRAFDDLTEVEIEKLAENHRMQRLKLQTAVQLQQQFGKTWAGDVSSHISQLMEVIDKFIESDKLLVKVPNVEYKDKLRNIIISLSLQKITNHIAGFIKSTSTDKPIAILDPVRPVRSTKTSMSWYTSKPTAPVKKSQISHIVADSSWEGSLAFELERNRIPGLKAWLKNDHVGFEIYYMWEGQTKTYFPDFVVKLDGERYLIIEVKGKKVDQDEAKWKAAREWVDAVNALGSFGTWEFKVLKDTSDIFEVVK